MKVNQIVGEQKTMSRAAKGHEKYGKDGMKALAKAGREGAGEKTLDAIRDKHDKYDEGIVGIGDKIKGQIQNIVSDLSDIPGMWNHERQTFTDTGMEKLKSVLKNNPKYVKYAINLNYKDYEAEFDEDATITRADQSGTEITDTNTKVKTVIPPEMSSALAQDPANPNEYNLNTAAVAPGNDSAQTPKVGSRVAIKKAAESLDNDLLEKMRTIAGLR